MRSRSRCARPGDTPEAFLSFHFEMITVTRVSISGTFSEFTSQIGSCTASWSLRTLEKPIISSPKVTSPMIEPVMSAT